MSKLKYYYQQLAECERLRKEIEWLEADPDLKRDMDFKNELETLIEQHNKTPREVYNLLAGDVSASESKHGAVDKPRRRARPLVTYKNPHTGETISTRGGNEKTLNAWARQYERDTVRGWAV
jgi:hypothetical protein